MDSLGFAVCLGIALVGTVSALVRVVRKLRQATADLKRFAPILDVEEHVSRLRRDTEAEVSALRAGVDAALAHEQLTVKSQLQLLHEQTHAQLFQARAAAQAELQQLQSSEQELRHSVSSLSAQQQQLNREVGLLEERAEFQQVALYQPRYQLARSEDYKRRLEQVYEQQKALVKAKLAATCTSQWTINNSRAEGKKVTDKILKLMLRAFNGECDALIAKVRYDNVLTYEARIKKSFEDINKLGAGFSCQLSPEYRALKLNELELTHEYQEKLQAERDEQRELKEQMREEQKALQELERAQREAEKEANRYASALERARSEANATVGAQHDKLMLKIAELEQRLHETEDQQRAISMAQQTRQGHVYVLSNIGSFGEEVFKIGMTRRLNPQERVDELGDASVPFGFDVHAMIRTEDAPRLEKALHDLFAARRLNKINLRKEFFRVTLSELQAVVQEHHGEFALTQYAEAAQYRQSLAMSQNDSEHANDEVAA